MVVGDSNVGMAVGMGMGNCMDMDKDRGMVDNKNRNKDHNEDLDNYVLLWYAVAFSLVSGQVAIS